MTPSNQVARPPSPQPAAALDDDTIPDISHGQTNQQHPQTPERPYQIIDEPTSCYYERAYDGLKGRQFWHSRRQEAVNFRDLDEGGRFAYLNFVTRGIVNVDDAIAEMPWGKWSDYAPEANRGTHGRVANGVGESDDGALVQLVTRRDRVDSGVGPGPDGGVQGTNSLPAPSLGKNDTSTGSCSCGLEEICVCRSETGETDDRDQEHEELSFRTMHRLAGFNAAPYWNGPHAKVETSESGVHRLVHPAVAAMQHPSKNRRSSSQAHMTYLTGQGVKAVRDRVGGTANFQAVGGMNATVVDIRSGTVSLFSDPEFREIIELRTKIRHAKERDV
ncbi:hypothetical protein LTR85_004183 [Meristemomyces frigidus]|nr:hypothetical protein LTR85_004183 [Meristemomyces frigidus]